MNSKIFLLFFLFSSFGFSQEVRIIKSDANSIEITFLNSPQIQNKESIELKHLSFHGAVYKKNSYQSLPSKLINIGVPSNRGNNLEIISSKSRVLDVISDDKTISNYSEENISHPVAEIEEIGLFRNLNIMRVRISPFQLTQDRKKIIVFDQITFRVTFPSAQINSVKIEDKFIKNFVVNWKVAANWGVEQKSLQKQNSSSQLANGNWYRFEAPNEGIYKISKNQLSQLGINPANVDPRTIKIYNNGVGILDEKMSTPYNVGLKEIAIKVIGEEDGKFDDADYILFYGYGNNVFDYDAKSSSIIRKKNIYSRKNYFYITSGGENGKRIQIQNSVTSPTSYMQTDSKAFYFLDEDKVNIGK